MRETQGRKRGPISFVTPGSDQAWPDQRVWGFSLFQQKASKRRDVLPLVMVTISAEEIFSAGTVRYASLGDERFCHHAKACFLRNMRKDKNSFRNLPSMFKKPQMKTTAAWKTWVWILTGKKHRLSQTEAIWQHLILPLKSLITCFFPSPFAKAVSTVKMRLYLVWD